MTAVSDSSPLILYARVGHLELLRAVFSTILIPPAVANEIRRGSPGRPAADILESAGWIQEAPVENQEAVRRLASVIDRGEAEAIALASGLGRHVPVLLDDRKGRRVGREYGFSVIGSGGLLVRAKERGHIRVVRPLLDDLRSTGLYLSEAVYEAILAFAGE